MQCGFIGWLFGLPFDLELESFWMFYSGPYSFLHGYLCSSHLINVNWVNDTACCNTLDWHFSFFFWNYVSQHSWSLILTPRWYWGSYKKKVRWVSVSSSLFKIHCDTFHGIYSGLVFSIVASAAPPGTFVCVHGVCVFTLCFRGLLHVHWLSPSVQRHAL